MKLLGIFSLIITVVAAVPSRNVMPVREALGLYPRIISGENAILGQFPWQILNKYTVPEGTGTCGGSLIDTRWVLTAGHCVERSLNNKITLGSLYSDGRYEPQAITIDTKKVIIHPNYERRTLFNDIALIDLQTYVTLTNYISLISLNPEQIESGVSVTASGWGLTSDNSGTSDILKHVMVTTITNTKCGEIFEYMIDKTLCCKGAPIHSICTGDSGGPLVKYDQFGQASHVGVSSFVSRSGCALGKPSGYVRTSHYIDWIVNTMFSNSKHYF